MQHVSSGIFSVPRMPFVSPGRDGHLNPIPVRHFPAMNSFNPGQFQHVLDNAFQSNTFQPMFSYAPQSHARTTPNFIRRPPVSQSQHTNPLHGAFANQSRLTPGPSLSYVEAYFERNQSNHVDNSTQRYIYPQVLRIEATTPILDQPPELDPNCTDLNYCMPPNCVPADFIPFTEAEKELHFKGRYSSRVTLKSLEPELYPDLKGDFILANSTRVFVATSHGVKYKHEPNNAKPHPICIPYNMGLLPIPVGIPYDPYDERASDSDSGSMVDEGISSPTINVSHHNDWNNFNGYYDRSVRIDDTSYHSRGNPSAYYPVSPEIELSDGPQTFDEEERLINRLGRIFTRDSHDNNGTTGTNTNRGAGMYDRGRSTRQIRGNNIRNGMVDDIPNDWENRAANNERRRGYGFYSPSNFEMNVSDCWPIYNPSDATARNRGTFGTRNYSTRSTSGLYSANDRRNVMGGNTMFSLPSSTTVSIDSTGRIYANTFTFLPASTDERGRHNQGTNRYQKMFIPTVNGFRHNIDRTGSIRNTPTFSMRDYVVLPSQTLQQRRPPSPPFRIGRETQQGQGFQPETFNTLENEEYTQQGEEISTEIGTQEEYEEQAAQISDQQDNSGTSENNTANPLNPLSAPFVSVQPFVPVQPFASVQLREENSIEPEPRENNVEEHDNDGSDSTDEALVLDDTDDEYEDEDEKENKSFLELNNQLKDAIANVPKSYTLRQPLPYSSGDSCPICFDAFEEFKNLSITRCGHLFCAQCIAKALEISQRCPFCTAFLGVELDVFPIKYEKGNYVINTANLTFH